MHTLALSDNPGDESNGGGSTVFHYDGDFSGVVDIVRSTQAGEKFVRVPFWQIRRLVAEYVRAERIAQTEVATDRELLGLPQRSTQ